MKVLFDVNVPRRLRGLLPNQTISTAQEQGWNAIENGELLHVAEAAKFEVMVTCDNIRNQQNLKKRVIAIVVLSTNDLACCSMPARLSRRPSKSRGRAAFKQLM